jgi:hypothetical protein
MQSMFAGRGELIRERACQRIEYYATNFARTEDRARGRLGIEKVYSVVKMCPVLGWMSR